MSKNDKQDLIKRCDRYIALYEKYFKSAGDPAEDRQYRSILTLRGLLGTDEKFHINDKSFSRATLVGFAGRDEAFHVLHSSELDELEKSYLHAS